MWYVPCKSCTYLASRLALSPNRSNWASTWASSPKYQQVLPKWFLRLWCISHKPCTYLAPKLTLFRKNQSEIPYDTHHQGVLSGASKLISKHMVCSMKIVHLSCIKLNRASTSASSPRSTNRCFQNGFLDFGALGANRVSCTETNTISKHTKARFHMTHVIKEFYRVCPN